MRSFAVMFQKEGIYKNSLLILRRNININLNSNIVMSNTKIPGLSFSLKRALGITALKRRFTKATGIPTTKAGIERKVGEAVIDKIFGKK